LAQAPWVEATDALAKTAPALPLMAFRVAHFNILGRHMAGSMWFHYARDFLPPAMNKSGLDWISTSGFPRCLAWRQGTGPSCRFYRFPVLLSEIRALRADVLCLVELDCFQEFREALDQEGYDAAFHSRPGRADGCGIFWKRQAFVSVAPSQCHEYSVPANDRIMVAQLLRHTATQRKVLVVSTHLHWDQEAGHQATEAEELLQLIATAESSLGTEGTSTVVCGDLNATPGANAHRILQNRFQDAGLHEGLPSYPPDAFTSLKPDVYYFARPRGRQYNSEAYPEWHLQKGRHEVIDYILYDQRAFAAVEPVAVPRLGNDPSVANKSRVDSESSTQAPASHVTKKVKYGLWAGGWAFASSAEQSWETRRLDPTWIPERSHGQLQLGIPNRLHGSDHLPIACTFRFRPHAGNTKRRLDPELPPGEQRRL